EDAAAAGIDEVGPRAQALQRVRVDDFAGRGGYRHVQRQDLRARQQLFQAHRLDPELGLQRRRHGEDVAVDDLDVEGLEAPRHRLADAAEAQNADAAAGQIARDGPDGVDVEAAL